VDAMGMVPPTLLLRQRVWTPDLMNKSNDSLLNLPHWLRNRLPRERLARLRPYLREPLGLVFRRELPKLAMIYAPTNGAFRVCSAARHFSHLA
jgi:hypothetical protein